MRIALVHDQLCEFGGSERVLVALKKIYPSADIYTLVYNYESLGSHKTLVKGWNIKQSWFGKIPLLNRFYSPFRFLTPLIWEGFDFEGYDLVISSSGSWMSKGIKTEKSTLHISYIHHPPRYLYGYETAVEWQKYFLVKIYAYIVNHFLRIWDFKSASRPDFLIANSVETKKRVKKFYRRNSFVIYPPVEIPKDPDYRNQGDYFLTVSRLARAKHIDILIKAANRLKFKLKIIGTGRDEEHLKGIAGETVEFLGNVKDEDFKKYHENAKAFLFASRDEEFGIAVVEAMGYGLPVIAYRSGGVPEYVKDRVNGLLFDELNDKSLARKISQFDKLNKEELAKMKKEARKTSERFTFANFKKNILSFVNTHARTSRG